MGILDELREELFVECTNCSGRGDHGRLVSSVFNARDIGKIVTCDVCGGSDDRLGHGVVLNQDADIDTVLQLLVDADHLKAECDKLRAELYQVKVQRDELLALVEKAEWTPRCPWCKGYDLGGHRDDCERESTLESVRGDE